MFRVRKQFEMIKKQGRKAFIPYLTYGFPDLKVFEQTILAIAETGADIIEVGMPFSDPVADGPVIQASSQIALTKGATLPGLLATLKKLRAKIDVPILLMSYYNPIFFMGDETFCRKAKNIVDGIVVPDLLPEEAGNFIRACRANEIDTVFFTAPTTDPKRLSLIDKSSSGFVYYVSVTGTTGTRKEFSRETLSAIKTTKNKLKAPVCVGFGISSHEQVRDFWKVSDGVIVGSAIVKFINANYRKAGFIKKLKGFVLSLCMK
jgi:tryptophan synthase alpha chain